MLKFIEKDDFLKVDSFEEVGEGVVLWRWNHGDEHHTGHITDKLQINSEEGEDVAVLEVLKRLSLTGEVVVNWLSDEGKAEIETRERRAIEKAEEQKAKLQGALINGEQISLTEENQNGMAAVMQGVNLAAEMGADIFPLNFNAQTPAGFKLMTFKAAADFKAFCLTFIAERQKFFK